MPGNFDNTIKCEPQNERQAKRTPYERAGSGEEGAHAGYTTLDLASTSPYGDKERKGLAPNANYPRRYS
ncbi:hypothetical protein [Aestuariivirga sp.]|uniref:hypothetical protein n=1 Tax=Aestuariivirga sp. TaxID=2650926 RepID=UPI0039E3C7AA